MKPQILTQKTSMLIFTALFFIYGINAMSYAGLEFPEGETTTREIAENMPACNIGDPVIATVDSKCPPGYFFYLLEGADELDFALDVTIDDFEHRAQLKTRYSLDYEFKNAYEVKIVAYNWNWTKLNAVTVTINVTDANDPPMFAETHVGPYGIRRFVPENTVPGTNIGDPVSAGDPDGSQVALTYSLSGVNADMFEIDSGTGQLQVKTPLDYEAFENDPYAYIVNIGVSDGMLSTETEVQIYVEPVNEFAPVFIEGEATTREINKTTEIGMNVGKPLIAIDMDAGETLEYSISDAGADMFEIDSSIGQLKTKVLLDCKTKSVYEVKVIVSDGIQTNSITVTIHLLTEVVDVPDPNLAAIIRMRLGLAADADITKKAMLELTTLDTERGFLVDGLEISSLTGLEHAENLTTLLLTSDRIADLTPLEDLTGLETLKVYANHVVFLTPLEGLTNLKSLNLEFNRINDITPLASLTNLTELYLLANNIEDLTPLKGLTNLTWLDLSQNQVTDLTPLVGLKNLKVLRLVDNLSLMDVTPLAGLVNLERLRLAGCPIEDLTPLAGLTAFIDILWRSAPAANGNRIDALLYPIALQTLDRGTLQARLQRLYAESDGSLKYQRAIAIIETTLASMRPDRTMLLTNYPNPFNPETWIPYHLAKAAHVQVTIYDAYGIVVRHLELGHQSAGYYTNRNHAAYWDGKNDFGERVASGIYFYQMQADTISPLRKMVILK